MNDDSTFEEAVLSGPTRKNVREIGEFYFRIHVLMIVGSVVIYLTVIGWMVWRLIVGGPYEFSVVPLVGCILLAVILTVARSMVIIAWDGRPSAHKVRMTPAKSKKVSVEQWSVRTGIRPHKRLD